MTTQLERPSLANNPTGDYSFRLVPRPEGLDDSLIAYNPSAIWTVPGSSEFHDIVYARVEPNRADGTTSHLGKTMSTPYILDIEQPRPLTPFYDAMEIPGEDPALTRISRKLCSGAVESAWLLSCVEVQPREDRPNEVKSLATRFYAGTNLGELELVAEGPQGMKDIRVSQLPNGNLGVYGRPQPSGSFSGNISYVEVADLSHITPETITSAPIIDNDLFPAEGGEWGGVNDVIRSDTKGALKALLLAHRARKPTEGGGGPHYEGVLFEHNIDERTIVERGVLATADMFPAGTVKADATVDTSDVVFTGGGYNGTLLHISSGVRDATIGLRSRR